MSLRYKTVLAVTAIVVLMMGLLYVLLRGRTLAMYREQEVATVASDLQRVRKGLDAEIESMDRVLRSWSSRSDTYKVMANESGGSIQASLSHQVFGELDLGMVAVADAAGNLVYAKLFDSGIGEPMAVTQELMARLRPGGLLSQFDGPAGRVAGIVQLGATPMLLVSRPIRDPSIAGPSRGIFLVGRAIGPGLEQNLVRLTELDLQLTRANVPMSTTVRDDVPETEIRETFLTHQLVGSTVLQDLVGQPAVRLTIRRPRPYADQAGRTLYYLLASVSLVGVAIGLVIIVLLDRHILQRMREVGVGLRQIRALEDLTSRVNEQGNDELADLGRDINRMLGTLETAHQHGQAQATLLDITRDAIQVIDLQGTVLYWNEGSVRMYGVSAQDAHAKPLVDHVQIDGEPGFASLLATTVRDGAWLGDLHLRTLDGRSLTAVSRWQVVDNWRGTGAAIFLATTDVTDQKRLEMQALRSQRLESLGTLAGGISHDLNNVLGPILSSTWLLRRRDKERRFTATIDVIERSANRGTEIVKQVLTFARGVETEHRVVQPRHLLMELQSFLESIVEGRVELDFRVPRDLWPVMADATQFHQAVLNIGKNAVDAMPDGGRLSVIAENQQLDAAQADKHVDAVPGAYVVIHMIDTGMGIPAALLDRIFDPFFTTKDVGKGTGLGLASVASIVAAHHGFLTVDSAQGKGTHFTLFFPASPDSATAAPDAPAATADVAPSPADTPAPAPGPSSGGEVLLVNSNPDLLVLLKESLTDHAFRVHAVSSLEAAAATVAEANGGLRLIVTDLVLCDAKGEPVIAALSDTNPAVPILVTCDGQDYQRFGTACGGRVFAFVLRPFSTDALLAKMREALESSSASGSG